MQGVENCEAILRVADGIMIARGDMGVEIPLEEVPVIQKKLIRLCISMDKPVITATQMLDSMMKNPRPTRAETSDVSNAIYQGTSAIMLSGETAAGAYPVEAVKTMARIAERTEKDIDYTTEFKPRRLSERPDVTNAISHATCTTAMDLKAAKDRGSVQIRQDRGQYLQVPSFSPDHRLFHRGTGVPPAESVLGRGTDPHGGGRYGG